MKKEHYHLFEMAKKMCELAERCIEFLNKDLKPEDRRGGGYAAIVDATTGEVVMVLAIGEFPKEKSDKYLSFAIGKATQLFLNLSRGHNTSWESRDAGFPQGAVYAREYIFSFSGQIPEDDEAISYTLASRYSGYHDAWRAQKGIEMLRDTITTISKNEKCFLLDIYIPPSSYCPSS